MKLSDGNDKLGDIYNISMTPVVTCNPMAKDYCGKRGQCYVFNFIDYPNVKAAYKHNTEQWRDDPNTFKSEFKSFMDKHPQKYFRWFVSGDCPDIEFAKFMIAMAKRYPDCQFLSFTKQYPIWNRFHTIPANLNIVYSAWPKMPMVNPLNRPVAYMQDGTETRITDDAQQCSGTCENCGICWYLKPGRSVYFNKH